MDSPPGGLPSLNTEEPSYPQAISVVPALEPLAPGGDAQGRRRGNTGVPVFHLRREQCVGGGIEDVFAFFKDPRNLEHITPPWLGFRVLEATHREMRLGTRISYRLGLHGIPLAWESRIAEYRENELFADEQVRGPYRRWYHRHVFREIPGGVIVEDTVEYELPLGVLGRLAHAVSIRRQLAAIFDYRALAIGRRFPVRAPDDAVGLLP